MHLFKKLMFIMRSSMPCGRTHIHRAAALHCLYYSLSLPFLFPLPFRDPADLCHVRTEATRFKVCVKKRERYMPKTVCISSGTFQSEAKETVVYSRLYKAIL